MVFDADLGNTIDDALALALLYGFQGKNEERVISVSTTKSSLKAAIFADILVRFYTGEPNPFAGVIPIGLSLSGAMAADTPLLDAVVAKSQFPRAIVRMNDTADPLALIRNALSAQFDQNAIVVLAGPATNLAGVLAMPGSRQLIAQKVRCLTIAGDAAACSRFRCARSSPLRLAHRDRLRPRYPGRRPSVPRGLTRKGFRLVHRAPARRGISRRPSHAV